MNTKTKIKKPVSTTPRRLRTTLLSLLVIFAVSGYAVNTYFFLRFGTEFQSRKNDPSTQQTSPHFSLPESLLPGRTNQPDGSRLDQVRNLIQQTADRNREGITITFNGTMKGKNGTIAMVNRKAQSVGSDIEGVKVIDVSDKTLTIEYQGETQELNIGQTVTVELR